MNRASHSPPSRSRGFTLLQLLIAVALIMALLAVLIPTFKLQVQRARTARCQDHLRRIKYALINYEFSNGSWPQRVVRTQAGLVMDSNVWIPLLIEQGWEADSSIFTCPEDPNAPPRWSATGEFYQRAVAYAPSYGLNQLTWRVYDTAPSDDLGARCSPSREDSNASKIILLADRGPDYRSDQLPEDPGLRRQLLERSRDAGRLPADDDFRVGMVEPPRNWLVPRHGGSINLISMAGTAERAHDVQAMARTVPAAHYDDCFLGGCTFCSLFKAPHYDFSSSDLYFWRGAYECSRPVPATGD